MTNEIAQDNVEVVQDVCGFRSKVEQSHRETKQLTGLESCECRKARIVRNHIGCAILVWGRLKQVDYETQRTISQVPTASWMTTGEGSSECLQSKCVLRKSYLDHAHRFHCGVLGVLCGYYSRRAHCWFALRLYAHFDSARPGMGSRGTGTLGNKCISRKPVVATGAAHRTALPITCRTSD